MKARAGYTCMAVLCLAGAWVFVAPFVVGFQARGASWVLATRDDVVTGGVLTGLAAACLLTAVVGGVRELRERARDRSGDSS